MMHTEDRLLAAWLPAVEQSLSARPAGAGLTDVADDTGASPSAAFHVLRHLMAEGRAEETRGAGGRTLYRARTFRFPDVLPAAPGDDPDRDWRVVDTAGNQAVYQSRRAARAAMDSVRGSSASYERRRPGGPWHLHETLLRG